MRLKLKSLPGFPICEPRVVISVGYAGMLKMKDGNLTDATNNGNKYDSDGIDISARVRITEKIIVGIRSEYDSLRNEREYNSTDEWPEGTFKRGSRRRNEIYASVEIPKTSVRAIIGYAQSSSDAFSESMQSLYIPVPNPRGPSDKVVYAVEQLLKTDDTMSDRGFVAGAEWDRQLGKGFNLNLSGRYQPKTDHYQEYVRSDGQGGRPLNNSSYSIEPRVIVTWAVAPHVELMGGWNGLFFSTDFPGSLNWSQYQRDQKVIVGTQFSF